MKSVFFLALTICSGNEGCLEERVMKEPAYATLAECNVRRDELQLTASRKFRYKCHKESQEEFARATKAYQPKTPMVKTDDSVRTENAAR